MTPPLGPLISIAFLLALTAAQGQEPGDTAAVGLPPGAADCIARLEESRRAAPERSERANDADPLSLGDICPELPAEIDAGIWGDVLPLERAAELHPTAASQLFRLAERYGRDGESAGGLATGDLAAIVDAIRPFDALPELSAWDRIMLWLQERLGLDRIGPGDRLLEWLRSLAIPDAWARVIVFSIGGLIVLLALAVVVNELRRSGALRAGFGSRQHYAGDGSVVEPPPRATSYEDLRRAPPHKQPVLLLGMVLYRMRARYASSIRDSLTHRELVAAADELGAPRHASIASVAAAAERVTFAGWRPAADEVEPLLADGRLLLDDLSAEAEGSS